MSAIVPSCPDMSGHPALECQLPKLNVEGSSPFTRSNLRSEQGGSCGGRGE